MTSFFSKCIDFFSQKWAIPVLLLLIAAASTLQNILLGHYEFWGGWYTHYNNYIIFKQSFLHLLKNQNLYALYPEEYADYYKYSPSFALLMAPFYLMPDMLGLFLWNALNLLVFYFSLLGLKGLSEKNRVLLFAFLIFEIILSTQNSQSNTLLAGLCILTYTQFEKENNVWAAFLVVLGTFIKLYSVLGALLLFFYPNKFRSILYMLAWSILFFMLPLLLLSVQQLFDQYFNWYILLKNDHNDSLGMSFILYLALLLPAAKAKSVGLLIGVLILLLPLLNLKRYTEESFRRHYLFFILLWMVLFNHKAESPTFVIALSAVGLWYFSHPPDLYKNILFWFSLLFTSLWFTDLIPQVLKQNFIDPHYLKAFFPLLVLFTLLVYLLKPLRKLIN